MLEDYTRSDLVEKKTVIVMIGLPVAVPFFVMTE